MANSIAVGIVKVLSNFSATSNPAVSDDNTLGYAIGSVWINTTTDAAYRCFDASTGAAVWTAIGSTGANVTLSNLTSPTSINQNLVPDSHAVRELGSIAKQYASVYTRNVQLGDNNASNTYGQVSGEGATTPSGGTAVVYLAGYTSSAAVRPIAVYTTDNATANSVDTGGIFVETGNKTAGTGNSGSILLQTGTSAGGTRGNVTLNGATIDVTSKRIVNVATPTATTDAVNKTYVDNLALTSKTANYTAVAGTDNIILCDATSASFTITLPAASGNTGISFTIKKTDSSVNTVTIDANASETIDGQLTQVIATQYQAIRIVSNGTSWSII
jgi:hypothetical protein